VAKKTQKAGGHADYKDSVRIDIDWKMKVLTAGMRREDGKKSNEKDLKQSQEG